jgi:hypothetical protein
MRYALILGVLFAVTAANAQWEIQSAPTNADLRGIHSLGNGIAWASGSDGTILRTIDDGAHWQLCSIPPDAEKLDFRGIQAFDEKTAIVMSTGKGALSRLYKTTDGCQTWKRVFTNPDAEGSWDAFSMPNAGNGMLLGDPINGGFSVRLIVTGKIDKLIDAGHPSLKADPTLQGAFAASNSALFILKDAYRVYYGPPPLDRNMAEDVTPVEGEWFGTGGIVGAFVYTRNVPTGDDISEYGDPPHISWEKIKVPLRSGTASAGIFALCFYKGSQNAIHGVAVGGDYNLPGDAVGTAAFSLNVGSSWQAAIIPPHGFRSAVAYDEAAKTWITVGPNGTDLSTDDGRNWRAVRPNPALHEPADADRNWNALSLPFVVGPHGRIGKLRPEALK